MIRNMCLVMVLAPTIGTCAYVTSSSFEARGFICNLSPGDTTACNTFFTLDNPGTISSPDGSNIARISVQASATAVHGSLSAAASAMVSLSGLPADFFAEEGSHAGFIELWTINTGLGGGFC